MYTCLCISVLVGMCICGVGGVTVLYPCVHTYAHIHVSVYVYIYIYIYIYIYTYIYIYI